MTGAILQGDESRRKGGTAPLPPFHFRQLGPSFIVGGAVLLFAGLVDMALLLYPVRFGDVDWEFGVLSQAIDALPLSTVGAILLSSGIRTLGRPGLIRTMAILFFVAALALAMVLVILALAFGTALDAINDPQAAPAIKRILFKAGANGLAYLAGYVVLGIMLWRSARTRHSRS